MDSEDLMTLSNSFQQTKSNIPWPMLSQAIFSHAHCLDIVPPGQVEKITQSLELLMKKRRKLLGDLGATPPPSPPGKF